MGHEQYAGRRWREGFDGRKGAWALLLVFMFNSLVRHVTDFQGDKVLASRGARNAMLTQMPDGNAADIRCVKDRLTLRIS